jgi:hypothetical protein
MASASPTSPGSPPTGRRRTSSVTRSIHSAVEFTEDLVLHHAPNPSFSVGVGEAVARAPSVREIRSGSYGQDGWGSSSAPGSTRSARSNSRRRRSSTSRDRPEVVRDSHGFVEPFAPLTEESGRPSTDIDRNVPRIQQQDYYRPPPIEERGSTPINIPDSTPLTSDTYGRTDHDRIAPVFSQRTNTSGYIAPPKVPWTTSTWIGLKGFLKWNLTITGFLITFYCLNVVAWGGMLFLLLCNASPAMCWAPVPNEENRQHMSEAAALSLPGPYYFNCNDINSPRRIWIEIDSQILNALFCVTGFGLAPWRFRDLYYLLRYRFTSARKSGLEQKMYGLRVLAGYYKSWFRLPGSETLDTVPTSQYLHNLAKTSSTLDLEASLSNHPLEADVRLPLPTSKTPPAPPTGIRAAATPVWRMDFCL